MGTFKDLFGKDKKLAVEGVWVEFGMDVSFKIAAHGNMEFTKIMRRLTKPHLRQIRKDRLPLEIAEKLLKRAMAKTILVDWKGLIDDDGKEIPYSSEKALKFLEDENDFLEEILDLAKDREIFREEIKEESEENLEKSSNGN